MFPLSVGLQVKGNDLKCTGWPGTCLAIDRNRKEHTDLKQGPKNTYEENKNFLKVFDI